ncbi:CinA family protein [Motiliproteus coralliicola]|uniref:CinA family protein n=1 Tax=Motiliproteus coralliicola TaxID=2283196 RepID=A0A369WP42_9GAMM|nr:CinA family protein [Motiliproteus coralliicola]RDE22346.1 CinA family protein [Motiliproteus coralliicola]
MIDLQVEALAQALLAKGWRAVTAESCTGGGVAHQLTALAGSSDWLEGGFVTYSNAMKQRLLGVPETVFTGPGAVSQECVEAMARGALQHSDAQISVAISGIAGPGGGTPDKPVGTVWFAWASTGGDLKSLCHRFNGDRQTVRDQAVVAAISGMLRMVQN